MLRPWHIRWSRIALAALAATAWWGGYIGGAAGSHDWSVISVRDVQAYRHVLELEDRLLLVRYALAQTPTSGEDAYGADASILSARDGTTTLSQLNPTPAYSLAAFYFPESQSSSVPWLDSGIQACLHASPTIFTTPQSNCDTSVTWNSEADLADTAQEIEDDLPTIMLALEADDPDIAAKAYVWSAGITLVGRDIVEGAFAALIVIAPNAFSIGQTQGSADFTQSTTTIAQPIAINILGSNSTASQDLAQLGQDFGVPYLITGLVAVILFGVGLYFAIKWTGGDTDVTVVFVPAVIMLAGLIGPLPVLAAVGLLVILGTAGGSVLIGRAIPS